MKTKLTWLFLLVCSASLIAAPSEQQLKRWLKRYPEADANGDGRLTVAEVEAFRQQMRAQRGGGRQRKQGGPPRTFVVDPGWDADRFPDHAVCYRSPEEIKAIYAKLLPKNRDPVTSYPRPTDGGLRIVGTGHSFMAPGYKTLPLICRGAGFEQPLLTHTGGGMTGSARYKWEQENGIFQFDGNPTPKLLASIANAEWDAMTWGPYYNDRTVYYTCWIDFCLLYNPQMKFYLADAWPQLGHLEKIPTSEDELSADTFVRLGREKNANTIELMDVIHAKYPDKVFVMPTSDAMVLAVQHYYRGELPGVEGINSAIGKKERSLWRDQLGHLGPGFDRLEGYVFYATLYGRSPELIEDEIAFAGAKDYPSEQLDRIFRRIAWQAVVNNPLSGVTDANKNGIDDGREETVEDNAK